ncbi:MAG TPA: SDR family NAD(P)-dependent oxidoreductase, partial [Caulobacteraceae bacterium]|nr:SDR family NAD(P)-dependent oxidoreductase [Caulobacteraceae bacterium]
GPLEAQPSESLYKTYLINLVAPARLAQAVLPAMKRQHAGRIVNIGSIFGSISFAHFASYSSSKAGLRSLSQAMRRELAETGVGVTYVAPRAVKTPLNSAKVLEFARLTGMAMDEPGKIARLIVEAVETDRTDVYLGFPEALFVHVNALFPRLVDRALRSGDAKARSLFHPHPKIGGSQ